jgi:hypothetical protein
VRYVVTGSDGVSVEVEAFDWMMAMVHAIERMGIEVTGWACETRLDGSVLVTDPRTGRAWEVVRAGEGLGGGSSLSGSSVAPEVPRGRDDLLTDRPRPPAPPPPPAFSPIPAFSPPAPVSTTGESASEPGRQRHRRPASPAPATQDPLDATPQPAPTRPLSARPAALQGSAPKTSGPPDDLAEKLFDLGAEIADAREGNDACRRALDVCMGLVACEAGSVLRGGLNDPSLTFVAVAGPAAGQLLGRKLSFGQGIVGAAFDLGITISVDDVREDPRHVSAFDQETGFRTRSVLCVPIQGTVSFHGAIQLLNPASGRFADWHRDAAEQLAATLASTLDALRR